jgi:hypothetical protein
MKFAIAVVLFAIVLPSNPKTSKNPGSRVVCERVKLFRHHRVVAEVIRFIEQQPICLRSGLRYRYRRGRFEPTTQPIASDSTP